MITEPVNFAAAGDPNGKALPAWPPFDFAFARMMAPVARSTSGN
jgi:hypothetical protein